MFAMWKVYIEYSVYLNWYDWVDEFSLCMLLAAPNTGLPWSMPNADQCRSKPGIDPKYRSIPIIADQYWAILIGIVRHWARIKGVLPTAFLIKKNTHCQVLKKRLGSISSVDNGGMASAFFHVFYLSKCWDTLITVIVLMAICIQRHNEMLSMRCLTDNC